MNEEEDVKGGATDEQITQAYKERQILDQQDPRTEEKFLEEKAKEAEEEEADPTTDKLESRGYKGNRKSIRQRQKEIRQRALADRDSEGSTITRGPGQVFKGGTPDVGSEPPDVDMRTGERIYGDEEDEFGNPVYNPYRLGASITTEIGLNLLLDIFSAAPPAQAVGSAWINYLAQKIRGETNINKLEMTAASIASQIPLLGSLKGATKAGKFGKGVLQGAVTGAIEETGYSLGRGEEADPFGGAIFGGIVGGAFNARNAPAAFDAIKAKLNTGSSDLLNKLAVPQGTLDDFTPNTAFAMGGPGSGRKKKVDTAALEAAGQGNIFKSFAADPRLGQTDDQIMETYKNYRIQKGDPYVEPKKAFKRGLVTRKIKVKDLEPIVKEHPEIPKDKINEYIQFVNRESKAKDNNLGKTITFLNDAYINGKSGLKKLGNITLEDLTPNKVRTGDPQEIAEDMSSILNKRITVKTLDNIIQEKVSIPVEISDKVVMQVTDLKTLTEAYMKRVNRFTGIPAFERGHVFAAKNIFDDPNITSLSDFKGNLEPEISRSIYNIVDGQSFNDLLKGVDLEDIQFGNRSRAETSDPDKVVARLLGTDYGLRESFLNFVYPQRALANKIPADAKASFIDDYVEEMNIALMDYDDGGMVGVHTLDFIRAGVLKKILPKYEALDDKLIEGLITTTDLVTGKNMAAEVNEAITKNLVNPQEIRRRGEAR